MRRASLIKDKELAVGRSFMAFTICRANPIKDKELVAAEYFRVFQNVPRQPNER
ncbi:hypothetical protein Thini_0085 [Thiothrix nivea DSM 5205]|uniref:Uncharacterized protein n=2 Tax=Thiothrix nivea TaxID=1031 RepID=A0A656H9P8_THINJ|nr:hypothetical protein Thini_0085 [Thiothrix nivea DSM 5205]